MGEARHPLWGVDTHEIVRLDVDGDILGSISHRPVLNETPILGRIEVVGNIAPVSGGIVAFNGNIGTIKTVSGSLFSGVIAVNGAIGLVRLAATSAV